MKSLLKRALDSFVAACLFVVLVPMLAWRISDWIGQWGEAIELVVARPLSAPAYILFSRPWFGLDCFNADSVSDKMTCAGILLCMNVLLFSVIIFVLLTIVSRLRRKPISQTATGGMPDLN
jgi:hypothetical protein